MLKVILTDTDGKTTVCGNITELEWIASKEAVAQSLKVVLAVDGELSEMQGVTVWRDNEMLFEGWVDTQTETLTAKGRTVMIRARSREAVLLDNEAMPQVYCMPSMPLLMKRHFEPLGFGTFRGSDCAMNGELNIVKGMSEWAVLRTFCQRFLGVEPRMDKNGVIDVTGIRNDDEVWISSDKCFSITRTRSRKNVISDIRARTYASGGYEMVLNSKVADRLNIRRTRYVNVVGSENKSIAATEKLLEKADNSYEKIRVEYGGYVNGGIGVELVLDGKKNGRLISEIRYSLNENGEKTTLTAEGGRK